jgi:outer membrane protein assembly factor BamB
MVTKKLNDLVYVGFNRNIMALDRYTGELSWSWKSPKGSGYPALILDEDRLIVSVSGYTYCLEPTTGAIVWENELKGFGTGISSLVSVRGGSSGGYAAQQQADAAAASSSGAL